MSRTITRAVGAQRVLVGAASGPATPSARQIEIESSAGDRRRASAGRAHLPPVERVQAAYGSSASVASAVSATLQLAESAAVHTAQRMVTHVVAAQQAVADREAALARDEDGDSLRRLDEAHRALASAAGRADAAATTALAAHQERLDRVASDAERAAEVGAQAADDSAHVNVYARSRDDATSSPPSPRREEDDAEPAASLGHPDESQVDLDATTAPGSGGPPGSGPPSDSDGDEDDDDIGVLKAKLAAARARRRAQQPPAQSVADRVLLALERQAAIARETQLTTHRMLESMAQARQRDGLPYTLPTTLAHPPTAAGFGRWVNDMELVFAERAVGPSDFGRQLDFAKAHWDRVTYSDWFKNKQLILDTARMSVIASWATLVAYLEKDFIPIGDAEAAENEYHSLVQQHSESMREFVRRVVSLRARIRSTTIDEGAFVSRVLFAVHVSCTKARALTVKDNVAEKADNGGIGLSLPVLLDRLVTHDAAVKREAAELAPQLAAEAKAKRDEASQQQQQQQQQHAGKSKRVNQVQHRADMAALQSSVSALALGLEAVQRGIGSQAPAEVADQHRRPRKPVATTYQRPNGSWCYSDAQVRILAAIGVCFRCGDKDHIARGCRKPHRDLSTATAKDF